MELFYSRLRLSSRSAQVRAELRNPYEMHRTLSKAVAPAGLGGTAARQLLTKARMLFRVDAEQGATVTVLVQCRLRPDWTAVAPSGYFADLPEVRAVVPCFSPGQMFAFRLRANPTVKRDGRRHGLYREEEQAAWLARKGVEGGFRILSARAVREDRAARVIRNGTAAELLAVRFDGLLRVVDPDDFNQTIEGGIGSAKGLGFGLLSLARPLV